MVCLAAEYLLDQAESAKKLMQGCCCCSLYNNVKPPSWLNPGTDLQLFKEGIEPKWEDPMCENGGKWTVQIPKAPNGKATLDAYWLNAVGLDEVKFSRAHASLLHCISPFHYQAANCWHLFVMDLKDALLTSLVAASFIHDGHRQVHQKFQKLLEVVQ